MLIPGDLIQSSNVPSLTRTGVREGGKTKVYNPYLFVKIRVFNWLFNPEKTTFGSISIQFLIHKGVFPTQHTLTQTYVHPHHFYLEDKTLLVNESPRVGEDGSKHG